MKKLLFIINPKAGRTAIKTDLFEIIMIFSDAGYEVVTYPTTGPDDAERKVIADGGGYDLIVCAGGDGTLENTVCGYMKMPGAKVPLGYIPVGTTNDFARSLRISRKPLEAARQIVEGEAARVDVGKLSDKYFIYIAAFGMFTDISYSTNQSLKKLMGHSAYVVEAVKKIANFKSYFIEATFDGATVTGEYIYGMVTNSFSVAGFKIRGAKHVVLDDGKFDCLLVKKPKNPMELQQILMAIITNEFEDNDLFFIFKAANVVIKCAQPIPWTLDGEFGGELTEAEIINVQRAISIYIDTKYEVGSLGDEIVVDTEPVEIDEKEIENLFEEITESWD